MKPIHALAFLACAAFGVSGCGIVSADFDGSVTLDAFINSDPDETSFDGCVSFDPNEDDDFRENKDKLDGGIIRGIKLRITELNPPSSGSETNHEGDFGVGQIDIRRNLDPGNPDPTCEPDPNNPFIEAAARWDPVPLEVGSEFELEIEQSVMDRVHALVFDDNAPLEVRFVGISDDQVNFEFQAIFDLQFDVRVP